MRTFWILTALLVLGFAAEAATVTYVEPEKLSAALAEAEEGNARVIVVGSPPGGEEATIAHMETLAVKVRARLAAVLFEVPQVSVEMARTLDAAGPRAGSGWLWSVVGVGIILVALGYAVDRVFRNWGQEHFRHLFDPDVKLRRQKIAYLYLRGAMESIGILLGAVVAAVAAMAIYGGDTAPRVTILALIGGTVSFRLLRIVLIVFLCPDMPTHRMPALDNGTTQSLYRSLLTVTAISTMAITVCLWMGALELAHDAHILLLIVAKLLVALLFAGAAITHRQTIGRLIAQPREEGGRLGWTILARTWHVLAIAYMAMAWTVGAVRLLLDRPDASVPVLAPVAALLLALVVHAALLWMTDRFFGDPGVPTNAGLEEMPTFRELAERVAAVIAAVVGVWFVMLMWGTSFSTGIGGSVWDVGLVLFLAYVSFHAARISIDRKIIEEGGFDEPEPGEEGSAGGASRMATLLPLFRNFLLFTVIVIAAMIALSELGVDVAPLFAGAGVIGLAVGFGAQTLIRDIFSGAFFLIDDAFRRGEYIDIGDVKGNVEKISVRSMQLRHHLGALHTVPFGEIKHLTNYSRDWVMMKLPLRLTYDTDPERVRKLIKKVGQELLEDPVVGDKFLQPLKSQGVFAMEDSAMIVRVKFMTPPGEQFVVRKAVYTRIRELFEREGIRFAHREVSVRIADTSAANALTGEQKQTVAGAGLMATEQTDDNPTGGATSVR